jgi:hypothetical protein
VALLPVTCEMPHPAVYVSLSDRFDKILRHGFRYLSRSTTHGSLFVEAIGRSHAIIRGVPGLLPAAAIASNYLSSAFVFSVT